MAKKKASKKAVKKKAASESKGTICLDMPLKPMPGEAMSFHRADLVFTGVDHSDISYEVRVFLNNPKATDKTPREKDKGYAGRFVVFGHGNCFGDVGHCDIPHAAGGPRHHQHPITPQKKILTITEPLSRVLKASKKGLETVTLVPVSKTPSLQDRGLAASVLKHRPHVSLRTYR